MENTRTGLVLAVLAALAALAAGCRSEPTEIPQDAAVRPVKLLTVEEAGSGQTRRYPAVVEAAKSSDLTFQVGGLLQELTVIEAQQVQRGTLLAKLDQRDYRNRVESAQAEYDNAETEYQRGLRLQKGNAISTSDVEQRKSRRDTAKAQLDTAQKALSDTELRAPFAGVVAKVHVEKFQNVQPQESILTLVSLGGGLEAKVDVPASVVATSQSRQHEQAFVILEAAPAVRIPAVFKEAVLEAASESQTYEVRFSFGAPDDLVILPGMNATVVIESTVVAEEETAGVGVAIPLAAVMSEGDRSYVWVIEPEAMTASKRWVTLEAGIGETAVVTDGLEPGETIAGAGAAYLAEGMKIRPWTE